jgi:hypothetical protein
MPPNPLYNAALLYFLHLQATYIRHLADIFLRASLLPSASVPREGGVVTVTSRYTITQRINSNKRDTLLKVVAFASRSFTPPFLFRLSPNLVINVSLSQQCSLSQ